MESHRAHAADTGSTPRERKRPPNWHEDYLRYREPLIRTAAWTRDHAYSYRDFKVGCVLMTIDPGVEPGEYRVYNAYNYKDAPGERFGNEKRCAERNVIEAAAQFGATDILAIVTVSKEKSTGDETLSHDALHPCRDCRDLMRMIITAGKMTKDSIICNVNDANPELVIEERAVGDLLDAYKKIDGLAA